MLLQQFGILWWLRNNKDEKDSSSSIANSTEIDNKKCKKQNKKRNNKNKKRTTKEDEKGKYKNFKDESFRGSQNIRFNDYLKAFDTKKFEYVDAKKDPQKVIFTLKDLKLIGTIGSTQHSTVRKYIHEAENFIVAIKFVNIPYEDNMILEHSSITDVKQEVKFLQALQFAENITTFYGSTVLGGELLICMENMDMDLEEYYKQVHKKYKRLSVEILGCIAVNILNALIQCKGVGIVHRDIKPQNILINKTGHIKLGDFGIARYMTGEQETISAGTLKYMGPEICLNLSTIREIRHDIWSFGIVLVECLNGTYPINFEKNLTYLTDTIKNLKAHSFDNILKDYSEEAQDFIHLCLAPYDERLTCEELRFCTFYLKYEQFADHNKAQKVMFYSGVRFYLIKINKNSLKSLLLDL